MSQQKTKNLTFFLEYFFKTNSLDSNNKVTFRSEMKMNGIIFEMIVSL